MPRLLFLLGLVVALGVQHAAAGEFVAGPDDYRNYLAQLKPGDRLRLQAGDYLRGLPLIGLRGLPDQPIMIEGPAQEPRARFIARPGHNTISLADSRYIEIRNLSLDGRNLPVDAVKAEGHSRFVHDVTLENLRITGHGNNQQVVGISTKCPARGWIIRGNTIEGAGTGIYLGNSDGSAPFWDGLIENNHILDSLGYNLQIKHQKSRPAEDQQSTAVATTRIRHNYFRKSANSSVAQWARPNVLLGHFPLQGLGSQDRYLVYGNVFFNNPTEALLQAEGRVSIYNNIFINPAGDAIHIQPHNDMPRDMDIFFNTVLASATGITVQPAKLDEGAYTQHVLANIVSAQVPIRGGAARFNVERPYQPELANPQALHELSGRLAKPGKPVRKLPAGEIKRLSIYPDWNKDNRGKRRDVSTAGAAFSAEINARVQIQP